MSARTAISRNLLRPVSANAIKAVPQSARHLSLLASTRTSIVERAPVSASKAWAVSGLRFKSTDKAWGPPIVTYEELKPLTEQPSDVSKDEEGLGGFAGS